MPSTDSKTRIQALKQLLADETASTQEELREQLERLEFVVNQSTISRDLRRVGAVKILDGEGRTIYRLPDEPMPSYAKSLADHVRGIHHNGAMLVINTDPGSASLIARHLDSLRSEDILGTIAGDDTIFVAPVSLKRIGALMEHIQDSLENNDR